MPMFKSKKQSKDAKKRFEHLMVLAKESPDRVFDLSECELRAIPGSVYSQCRVLRMESLIVHTNLLKSIKPGADGGKMSDLSNLKILDLHNNKITQLPAELGALTNLKVLNVENNQLTELPQSIGDLKLLQTLLLRDNLLNCLPNTVKNLKSLRTLDVSGTNKVYYLPKTLCHVRTLEVLVLSNPALMEYPSPMIATEGLEAMQKFMCKDVGIDYIPPSQALASMLTEVDSGPVSPRLDPTLVSANIIEQYQRKKDEKRLQHVELERKLAEEQKVLAVLSSQSKEDKQKTQAYIKESILKNQQSIKEQQVKKDIEKEKTLKLLKEVEAESKLLLDILLNDKQKSENQEHLLKELRREREEQMEMFKVSKEVLDQQRKQETLAAMESILSENAQYKVIIDQYLGEKDLAVRRAQESIAHDDTKLNAELKKQGKTQEMLVEKILLQERQQKEAFATLLFQRDAVQSRLLSEIAELQEQLTNLSALESKKSKLKMDQDQELLRNIRNDLTDLLVQLLKEKDNHEQMMKQRLVEMEQQREDDQIDFWLVQYQKLLDTKPQVLIQKEDGLEINVMKILRRSNAAHHAPSFARHKITMENLLEIDERKLQSIGVFEIGLRQNIMKEIENYIAEKKQVFIPEDVEKVRQPAAEPQPETSTATPSAPSPEEEEDVQIENECVVCLDKQSDCVLLLCGHVCACYECAQTLNKCPMCRSDIMQKIKIFRS
uniref:ZF(RING)-19 zinc finger protein n=1 Tax=Phallusia mammillata TaxID=59560 RepID=A0A6F9DKP1_9ASCI|nr:ZF(RING)-19 zinc finger protein [Phallusia mammillata]